MNEPLSAIPHFEYWQCQGCGAITSGTSHVNPCPDCDSPTFRSPPHYEPNGGEEDPLD